MAEKNRSATKSADESNERRCPACREPLTAITTHGPGEHRARPCGCPVAAIQTRAVVGHRTERPTERRQRDTEALDRGRGARTDGGPALSAPAPSIVDDDPDDQVAFDERDSIADCSECSARWSAHRFPVDDEAAREFVEQSARTHAARTGHEVDVALDNGRERILDLDVSEEGER
jgi:hypothetical protein